MKKMLTFALLAIALAGCGGDDDDGPALFVYEGTLSGTNCFSGTPTTATVRYAVTIAEFESGGAVTVLDESGTTWVGAMTGSSGFIATNPTGDSRTSIIASDVTATGAHFISTTVCVSFRCCTPRTGDLRA